MISPFGVDHGEVSKKFLGPSVSRGLRQIKNTSVTTELTPKGAAVGVTRIPTRKTATAVGNRQKAQTSATFGRANQEKKFRAANPDPFSSGKVKW